MRKQALISVSDKTGVVPFARELQKLGYHILSTGGTAKLLLKEGVECQEVGRDTYRIIGVSSPVHLASFYHQEETILVFGKFLDSRAGHLFNRRLFFRIAVQVISHFLISV